MHIRWTTQASDDIVSIVKHIQEDSPAAARQVAQDIIASLEKLETFPHIGRTGKRGTRELVTGPYVVVYRVRPEFIELLHIWHGAQDWR